MSDNSISACYCFDTSANEPYGWACDGSCACNTDYNLDDLAKGKYN